MNCSYVQGLRSGHGGDFQAQTLGRVFMGPFGFKISKVMKSLCQGNHGDYPYQMASTLSVIHLL